MPKPPKNQQKRETLAMTLVNAFFPTKYDPPASRVAQPLVGWSGLSTDEPPANPYAWGQRQNF